MYNVKCLQYPSGWQYRIYNKIVGIHDNDPVDNTDKEVRPVLVWNEDIEDYESVVCNPDKMWLNPFSLEWEKAPKMFRESDLERSAKSSMGRTVNKVYHLARSNVWEWFFTFTFDPDKVDSFDYEVCTKTLSKWLNNLRRLAPDLKYLVVPEKHESGRFHFHGLFAGCENITFTESGHGTKDGDIVYNIGNYKLGFSTATRVKDNSKVVKYISKYITKDLCAVSRGKKRYWASRNLDDVEAQEVILSNEEVQALTARLEAECLCKKVLESDMVTVTYFEMEVNKKNE